MDIFLQKVVLIKNYKKYQKMKLFQNTYTISYVDELNATNTNPTSYNVITSDIELENLEKAGYTFQGWYTTENYTV